MCAHICSNSDIFGAVQYFSMPFQQVISRCKSLRKSSCDWALMTRTALECCIATFAKLAQFAMSLSYTRGASVTPTWTLAGFTRASASECCNAGRIPGCLEHLCEQSQNSSASQSQSTGAAPAGAQQQQQQQQQQSQQVHPNAVPAAAHQQAGMYAMHAAPMLAYMPVLVSLHTAHYLHHSM